MTKSPLVYHHYVLYALLIVCNTVIPSAAAWNFSLVSQGPLASIDAYMIFLGALSLIIVFPIFFFDLFARDAITSTVRIECLWVGVLFLFHFPGSVASTVLLSDACSDVVPRGILNASNACQSSRLLQAFSWISSLNLLFYFAALVTCAALFARTDATVWHMSVKRVPWSDALRCRLRLRTPPTSPVRPAFNTDILVAAPQPRRALDQRYAIEHLTDEDVGASMYTRGTRRTRSSSGGRGGRDRSSSDVYVPQRAGLRPKLRDEQGLYPSHVRAAGRVGPSVTPQAFPPEQPDPPIVFKSLSSKRGRSRTTPGTAEERSPVSSTSHASPPAPPPPPPPSLPAPPPPARTRSDSAGAQGRVHERPLPHAQVQQQSMRLSPAPGPSSSAPALAPPSAFHQTLPRPRRPAGPRSSLESQTRPSLDLGRPSLEYGAGSLPSSWEDTSFPTSAHGR